MLYSQTTNEQWISSDLQPPTSTLTYFLRRCQARWTLHCSGLDLRTRQRVNESRQKDSEPLRDLSVWISRTSWVWMSPPVCCTILADGWFIFGTRRIRYLMGLVHWAHDFTRINGTRNLDAFDGDAIAFRKDLDLALHRAKCRKKESNPSWHSQ